MLATSPEATWTQLITERDEKVTKKAQIVINPGFFIKILLKIIQLEERGSVKRKIEILEKD